MNNYILGRIFITIMAISISSFAITKESINKPIVLGMLLFDDFELLDVAGPLEMFGNVPTKKLQIVTIAETTGAITSSQNVQIVADYNFATAPALDILLVPGGMGTRQEVYNTTLLNWIEHASKNTQITASICTGAALLAKTGLLDNQKATSNKLALEWVMQQGSQVEWVAKARWVDDGKFVTSSGVSAGIDMSLHLISRLFGKQLAQEIATTTEYLWQQDASLDYFYEGN